MQHHVKSFFNSYDILNENVQAAKEYLLKLGAEKLKKEKRDLTDEEKKQILSDQSWQVAREITKNNPGYALTFLKFAKEQKAPEDILQTTLEEILKNKDRLKELPHDVAQYADHQKTKNDPRPGYEVLIDDLMIIEKKSKLKKFYNALGTKMKKAFESASDGEIKKLIEISNGIDALKPKKDGKNPWRVFGQTLFRFENDKGYYPQFNDLNFAFKSLIEEAEDFVENWKMGEDEYIAKLEALKPQLDILYYKDGILALSTREPNAQREIQGILSWCLKYDSHFWNYAGGDRVQIVIFDKNRPNNDILRSIGVTVEPNGKIYAAYDANNHAIKDKNSKSYGTIYQLLRDNNFPEKLVTTLERKIPDESNIKRALMLFYRKEESKSSIEILKEMINLNKSFLKGLMNEEEWERICDDVIEIILNVRKMNKEDFKKQFLKAGIYTEPAWLIWDKLIGNDYTPAEMQEILKKTERGLSDMQDVLDLYRMSKSGKTSSGIQVQLTEERAKELEAIIKDGKSNLEKAKQRIK